MPICNELDDRFFPWRSKMRVKTCEEKLELQRSLYDELHSQAKVEIEDLQVKFQQAQEAATALSCDVTRLSEERQQAIDALRDTQEQVRLALVEASRNTTDGNNTRADGYAAGLHKALYLFPDAAALVRLGEKP